MAQYNTLNDGSVGTVTLRDYRHAARIFSDDHYRLSPKYGFLFYVEFDFNPLITAISNQASQELGMIVKSVTLPKYTIDTKTHNAYNRKNIVQNKINYDPVNISFHDDQSDNVRQFWYDYYSYFYRDPDYADATYSAPHKYQSRPSFDWGYTPRPAVGRSVSTDVQPYQYIQAIRIYSLYQQNFSEYELVNPTITSFKHGDHANGENNFLEHQMSLQFETVKYKNGYVTRNTAGGFIDLHYDTTESPNGTNFGKGEVAPHTYSDNITDLANTQTTMNSHIDVGLAATSPSLTGAFSNALNGALIGSIGGGGLNIGGFSIPSLGSLNQGIPSTAALGQQLQARAAALVGATASSLANGVVGGISAGLGPNGNSLIKLAAGAIVNPKGTLRTIENAAIGYASGLVTNYVSGKVTELSAEISGQLSGFVSENISGPLSQAFGDASSYVTNQFYDTFGSATGAASFDDIMNSTDGSFDF